MLEELIAPEFGNSIYTWGSIIGVFLASLSLGYYIGGKRAKINATPKKIASLLLYVTIYIAFLIFAGDFIMNLLVSVPIPARFASLVPVTLLFGPPVYMLGFITPYAAQLSEKQNKGDAAGHVFALGTFGSIVGAFATTFFLIPALSVEVISFLFGTILILTAFRVMLPTFSKRTFIKIFLVSVLLLGSITGGSAKVAFNNAVGDDVLYQTQTPYQELQVIESQNVRTLYLGGQKHSAMSLKKPKKKCL